ncbi:MAG: hypothetical protein IKZ54_00260 [Bacteroidales bacterium]|nr:hypothetical protein [Bacteroidales bacterium]
MNEKIVPAKIIHGCAKTWHTLPADLRPATPPPYRFVTTEPGRPKGLPVGSEQ